MIEVLPDFPSGVFAIQCAGQISREDYEKVMIPALEAPFAQHQMLRMYRQVDSFSGMSPGAWWDDAKVSVEQFTQLTHWERVAIVTGIDWLKRATNLYAFLLPLDVRYLPIAEAEQAGEWIVAAEAPTS
jgi:hypothetical protein